MDVDYLIGICVIMVTDFWRLQVIQVKTVYDSTDAFTSDLPLEPNCLNLIKPLCRFVYTFFLLLRILLLLLLLWNLP